MCIVIFMKEKQIQYYDSNSVGAGNHMDSVLQYLVDEDKAQRCVKPEEWALVTSTESVPKQKNTFDCGASFATSYHKTLLYFLIKKDVTSFRKPMALANINFANNTKV
jgi:Ulp1 family protease